MIGSDDARRGVVPSIGAHVGVKLASSVKCQQLNMRSVCVRVLCVGALAGTATSNLWSDNNDDATTSTSTTSTSTSAYAGCGGVTRCLDNRHCGACLLAINNTQGFTHTAADLLALDALGRKTFALREYQVEFFETLLSTASCSTNVTPLGILYPALLELSEVAACVDTFEMVVGQCILSECVLRAYPLSRSLSLVYC